MSAYTVVVTDHSFKELALERDELSDIAEIELLREDSDEERAAQLARADAILNTNHDIDRDMIERAENCKIIARYVIGLDNVDVEAATEQGIYVTNAPDYCVDEVATHTLALILNLQRHVTRYDRAMEDGEWRDADVPFIKDALYAKTVGLLGYGRISQNVADRLAPFGPEIVTADPYVESDDIERDSVTLVDREELLSQADIISVHVPLTPETRHMLSGVEFDQMKDSAFVVNVARGPIVDQEALYQALQDGVIGGAGLDVFENEPLSADSPLRTHERVVTTPHIAWQSGQANEKRRHTVVENVRKALSGEVPPNAVNDVGRGS